MSLTSVKGLYSLVPQIGVQHLAGQGMLSQGQAWFVRPSNGLDGNSGKKPHRAMKTLYNGGAGTTGILGQVTANQNDTVYMMAESNTAGSTTDYQSNTTTAALTWSNDLTHLIGVNAGPFFSQRSRIALLSTFNSAIPMFLVTANDCIFQNIEFFAGVTGTSPKGAVQVQGSRNHFVNCHIAGIGATTNDIAGAYSLYLNGGKENVFERCVIGLDTVVRGTNANQEILIDNGAARNVFKDCIILSCVGHATNHPQVYFGSATALGDPSFVLFDNCTFINTSVNYAFTNTYVFATAAALTAGGAVIRNCAATGVGTGWSATGDHCQVANMAAQASAFTVGLGYGFTA